MTTRVLMLPHLTQIGAQTHGISRVIEAYFKYLPDYDVELVDLGRRDYDLVAAHAGCTGGPCEIAHLHGIYWTADYDAPAWEYSKNGDIVASIRQARAVTVPSAWVAETFQRDMHYTPHIVPHGIDWQDWQHKEMDEGFVLWNKNRGDMVCDPQPVIELAMRFPRVQFVTTFTPKRALVPVNVRLANPEGGRKRVLPPDDMRRVVQQCGVYLATVKETFGIGILEAMASGRPVLGFAHGGIVDLVQHGVNGYLAQPGDYDDLAEGLNYCLQNAATLGDNGRDMAHTWTWQRAVEQVAGIYRAAAEPEPPTVAVVIPCYNKQDTIERAIESAVKQDYSGAAVEVIVVDDGSTDDSAARIRRWITEGGAVQLITQENQGVAHARNKGIAAARSKYICCLDGDDWLELGFLTATVEALEKDRSLSIAYTGLRWYKPDGSTGISPWPSGFDFDQQLRRRNQVPTCCTFRRSVWERLGGYRQRYAPQGAGAEDAEFWLRAGAFGYRGAKVTDAALFNYSWLSGQVSGDKNYHEIDWLVWHPWAADHRDKENPGHPFASLATPKRHSHPVRAYDQPILSVVIPVGPGHEGELLNALDSLEAQTFLRWEVIVVWDTGNPDTAERYRVPFPFVRWAYTDHKGSGAARNAGAALARGSFLLFLDADDWLYPECLAKMMQVWNEEQAIVYTDYVGKAFIDDQDWLKKKGEEGRVRALLPNNEVVLGHQAFDFDCERVMRQPETPPYVFCNVTSLIPKVWHDEIGGFDEAMPSWEDVDYHWRMARAGHCYVRLAEELMVYRFYTGGRRDAGLQQHRNLLQYIRGKYEKEQPVGCSGCGKSRTRTTTSTTATRSPMVATSTRGARMMAMPTPSGGSQVYQTIAGRKVVLTDNDLVLARYISEQRGDRQVIGPHSQLRYSMHSPGDVFLVHRADLASPQFQEVRIESPVLPPSTTPHPVAPPQPVTAAQPVLHVAPAPDVAQDAEDGGLPMALAHPEQMLPPSAPVEVPIAPPETAQFMEPERMTVTQIEALMARPSTSKTMVRAMLAREEASEKPRAAAIKALKERLSQ